MTFVWRTGTTSDAVLQLTPLAALGPRIVITLALVLGLIYLCLVIIEFRHYGKAEVDEWNNTVQGQYDQQLFDPTSAGPVGSGGGGYITPQHGSGRRNSLFPGAAQARADTLSPPTTASAWLPAAPLTPSYRAASPVPYVPNDLNLTLAQSHMHPEDTMERD
ncbi:hypothetical protein C0993_012484 [Termitomyces sp. T159_Od127]|nr:hypothetical protein C0993_012484 [Termitomyces sp. T159_Od127]